MTLRGKKLSVKEPARVQPYHWPDWEALPSQDVLLAADADLPAVTLDELKSAAKSAYRLLSERDDAAEIAAILRDFDERLRLYYNQKLVCALRQFEVSGPELKPELLRYVEEEPELESLLNTLYRPLLEKGDLLNLADFFGKQLFLRLQSRQSLYSLELTEHLQTEKILAAAGPAAPGFEMLWKDCQLALAGRVAPERPAYPRQTREGSFRQLLSQRRDLAQQLQLPDFKSLAFLRAERFDEHSEDLNDFLKLFRRFFLLLAIEIRQDWAETEGISPEQVFENAQRLLPPAEQMPVLDAGPQDFNFISSFIDQILKPSAPHFFLRLHEKSLLRFRPEEAGGDFWAECVNLPETELPYLLGRLTLRAENLPSLLHAAGCAFAWLCNYQDRSFEIMRQPQADLLELWGSGLVFLACEFLPKLFEDENEGRRYRNLFLGQAVQRLCYQAMLFEFETELAALERKGRDNCERLWVALVRRYYPDAAERSVWLRSQREAYAASAQLWQRPFSSFGYLRALMSGFSLWDLSRSSPAESLRRYETLCTLGCSDTTRRLLEQARFPEPWAEGTVKRLVYQLAFALGY